MKKIKLAIIDKDGTITETVSGATFVQSPTDQKLIDGVQPAIAKLVSEGYTLAIASNQGGVAAGHKSLKDAIAEMDYCLSLLPEIEYGLICPDFKGERCWQITREAHIPRIEITEENLVVNTGLIRFPSSEIIGKCRKPESGMLKLAITISAGVSDYEAIMIGDRPEDEQAAHNAQIPFIHAKDWWIK
jgi:D-glycero-D-manno-heptose 1,7-bisphosphate phosphatase